jgi:cyclase
MPLAVGGGVRTVAHARDLVRCGADKVVLNSGAHEVAHLIEDVAGALGSQCVVASIDVKRFDGRAEVVTRCASTRTGLDPVAYAEALVRRGAGELLVTSVDRDGTMEGYDLDLVRTVAASVDVPVIASGGAGSYAHMADAIDAGAAAVAAGAMFYFTEQTPLGAKRALKERGLPVRE